MQRFDVLVSGAGLVGAAFAAALGGARLGSSLRIGVLEPTRTPDSPAVRPLPAIPDSRVIAVNRGTVALLRALGVWDTVAARRAEPFAAMHIWDRNGPGQLSFKAETTDEPLGWIVENNVVADALWEALGALPNVQMLAGRGAAVARVELAAEPLAPVVVTLADKTQASARLLVGADGPGSAVRTQGGFAAYSWDYGRTAVVATVELGQPCGAAWQRFLPHGPVALLPLGGALASVVWSTTPEHATQLQRLSGPEFAAALSAALQGPAPEPWGTANGPLALLARLAGAQALPRPPRVTGVLSERRAFPLRFSHATAYTRPRVALVGDAAHTVHPLAGQGANVGMADAAFLAGTVLRAVETGADIGDGVVLDHGYTQLQRPHALAVGLGVDLFHRGFGVDAVSQVPGVAALRGLGMLALDAAGPAKAVLAEVAAGQHLLSALESGLIQR